MENEIINERIKKWFSRNKNHLICLSIITLIFVIVYFPNFSLHKTPLTDPYSSYYPRLEILRQSIFDYGEIFPLWNIYKFGGSTYVGIISPSVLSLGGIYTIITGNSLLAIKMWELSVILIAGLSMYFLLIYLLKSPYLGLIGALIFMNNGYQLRYLSDGNLFTLTGYAFFPLLIYFFLKVFKSKDLIRQSVIFGVVLGIFFWFAPDYKVFPFFMIFLGVYSLVYIITSLKKSSIKKLIIFFIVFSIIFSGLVLPKILPVKENLEGSWREGRTYEQVRNSRRIKVGELFTKIVEPVYEGMPKIRRKIMPTAHLGIIAFSLMIYGFYKKYKNRLVLALGISALISLLFAMGTPIVYIFWKFVPGFSSFRFLERGLNLFVVSGTILAVFGANELIKKFKDKKRANIAIVTLIILIILNLVVFNFKAYPEGEWITDLGKLNRENDMLIYISQQEGIFRYNSHETVGIDATTEPFTTPHKIEQVYGFGGWWNKDYFNIFLVVTHQSTAKFLGIMNTKYVSSMEPVNISGLKLIKKFKECTYCAPLQYVKIHGPYLYENEKFLPRAYNTKSSILIIGSKEGVTQMTYGIMLDDGFNPKTQILVFEIRSIGDYGLRDLNKYDSIVLTQGSLSGNSNELNLLNQYVNNGGRLYPDVTKGVNQINKEGILSGVLSKNDAVYNPIPDSDIIRHNFDKITINLNKKITGWLVLSEKFSLFKGWKAYSKDKEFRIYRVNGVVSAVYIDEPVDKITFEYRPKSWIISRNIFILTLIILVLYFGYYFVLVRKRT